MTYASHHVEFDEVPWLYMNKPTHTMLTTEARVPSLQIHYEKIECNYFILFWLLCQIIYLPIPIPASTINDPWYTTTANSNIAPKAYKTYFYEIQITCIFKTNMNFAKLLTSEIVHQQRVMWAWHICTHKLIQPGRF